MSRTLVLGGARSGKSGHAESLLSGYPMVRYLATGRRDASDPDWHHRIERHVRSRPGHWQTVEIAHHADLAPILDTPERTPTLVDDLGTWLTGALDDLDAWSAPRGTVTAAADHLVEAVAAASGPLVFVTPEVGLGVIPESRAGRLFRDEIGALNARLAQVCDRVVLVVAGLPLTLTERAKGTR